MPDISRSDSNRSDASRPRVSFNRDVHVKRISGPRTANAYSLSSDGTSFVPTSIRRERPMTKKEITKEAENVLKQVDKISCKATSNVLLETDKPKTKKKRKDSFSFLKRSEKADKGKNSSSDGDSGSSQEYRIYRVNSPANNSLNINNSNKISYETETLKVKNKKNEKKSYDFMSLDRKKLKKEKKNKNLEYLSLERNNDILEKMKKEKPNKTIMSMVFDKNDSKNKKPMVQAPGEIKESKGKPKIVLEMPDTSGKRKQLSPIIESPRIDYFEKKKESNVDKMVKKLSEKTIPKLNKNTGMVGVIEPQGDVCHNDNKPFSYTSGETLDKVAKPEETTAEDLRDGKEDLKSNSPTSDVIYAQVIVGGRDGNVKKPTVNERVASNEVGRVFVGDESNQSQVGLHYKIDSNRNDGICERVTPDSDEMWQAKSEYVGKKEREESFRMGTSELYGENPGRRELFRRKSNESDHTSPSPGRDEYTRVIRVAPKYDAARHRDKSPTDLHDLSIRREILLSRSESQAKERFNSLKRLQEPTRVKRHASNVNGIRPGEKILTNDVRYLGDDIKVNEKFATNLRKIPKDVELVEPVFRKKREPKTEVHPEEREEKYRNGDGKDGRDGKDEKHRNEDIKEEKYRNSDKIHVIKTDDDDNLLRKLAKIGKSKSFQEDKPKNKRMEKVKMLFMKKKDGKSSESDDDPLASRYIEYRGSDVEMSDRSTDSSPRRNITKTEVQPLESGRNSSYSSRKRISTPASDSMGTLTRIKNEKNKESHWLKSLDKTGKKGKPKNKMDDVSSELTNSSKPTNLRFFGDTDQESTTNETDLPDLKLKYSLHRPGRISDSDEDPLIIPPSRSESRMTDSTLKGSSAGGKHHNKSKYDLDRPDYGLKQMNHSLHIGSNKEYVSSNVSDTSTLKNDGYGVTRSVSSVTNSTKYATKEKLRNLKSTPTTTIATPEEPLSRRVKSHGNLYSQGGRRRLYDSSAESATEGDSSQHSSKSMIYLHAATVGDIPGPRNIYKSDRRSQSREELSSIADSTILVPGKKTLSRSISVLAPWRPKHNKEDRILHYDSAADYNKGKPPTGVGKNKRSSSKERKPNELRFNTIGKENRRRKALLR